MTVCIFHDLVMSWCQKISKFDRNKSCTESRTSTPWAHTKSCNNVNILHLLLYSDSDDFLTHVQERICWKTGRNGGYLCPRIYSKMKEVHNEPKSMFVISLLMYKSKASCPATINDWWGTLDTDGQMILVQCVMSTSLYLYNEWPLKRIQPFVLK